MKHEEERQICPMVAAAKILGSMWSLVVISYLTTGPKGFNELLRLIPSLNSKTLSRTLKALQSRGLVKRNVVSLQPFAVSYSLTPMAEDLKPLLEGLRRWSVKWLSEGSGDQAAVKAMANVRRAKN
uniref:Transcriptional regulator n=1 Tax=Caldiarchaeum subterraneum TaxID=311458 RepID=A0A7C5QJK5_CALS0